MHGSGEDSGDLKKKKQLCFGLRRGKLIFGARRGDTSSGLRDARELVELRFESREGSRFSELAKARPVVCDGGTARGGIQIESQQRKKLSLCSCRKTLNSKR